MFSKAVLVGALAALAAAQSSVLTFTNVPNPVTDGQPQAITYATNDTSSPVTILLRKGPSTDLETIETLTESATGGQYIWTPPADLPNGNDYALQITQGEETNYFGPFVVQGASASGSSSASASASASGAPTNSANSTTSAPVTPPAPIGTAPPGTGVAPPRNTTLSSATLTAPTSTATLPAGTGSDDASATGANPTESAEAPESTGAASSFSVASGIALFGAIAAGIFLQ